MQTYDDGFTEGGKCENCSCCKECSRFTEGDRVELTVTGVLALGLKIVSRGTVKGQAQKEAGIILIHVHWDGYPERIIGQVNPHYIQKLNGNSIALL